MKKSPDNSNKNEKKTKKTEPSFAERAVNRYNEADARIQEFMSNPEIVEMLHEYHSLINERNSCLDEAIRAVKSELQRSPDDKILINGIGAQKRVSTDYDVEILRAEIPKDKRDIFMSRKITYEVNKDILMQLVQMQEVSKDVVDKARSTKESIASMPGTPKVYSLPPLHNEDV